MAHFVFVGSVEVADFLSYRHLCANITPTLTTGFIKLWRIVIDVVAHDLSGMRSGVVPDAVKEANRAELTCMFGRQILGSIVSRAAPKI